MPLDRNDVLQGAIDLVNDEGVEGLTMRRLAERARREGRRALLALRRQAGALRRHRRVRHDGPARAAAHRRVGRAARRGLPPHRAQLPEAARQRHPRHARAASRAVGARREREDAGDRARRRLLQGRGHLGHLGARLLRARLGDRHAGDGGGDGARPARRPEDAEEDDGSHALSAPGRARRRRARAADHGARVPRPLRLRPRRDHERPARVATRQQAHARKAEAEAEAEAERRADGR